MKADIEIARETVLAPIQDIAAGIGIPTDKLEQYGRYMAKVPEKLIDDDKVSRSKLILVTAMTPTKSGNGKTTVSIGLALGMAKIGKRAILALREPSLGPCFGMKGGAAGGGGGDAAQPQLAGRAGPDRSPRPDGHCLGGLFPGGRL